MEDLPIKLWTVCQLAIANRVVEEKNPVDKSNNQINFERPNQIVSIFERTFRKFLHDSVIDLKRVSSICDCFQRNIQLFFDPVFFSISLLNFVFP